MEIGDGHHEDLSNEAEVGIAALGEAKLNEAETSQSRRRRPIRHLILCSMARMSQTRLQTEQYGSILQALTSVFISITVSFYAGIKQSFTFQSSIAASSFISIRQLVFL